MIARTLDVSNSEVMSRLAIEEAIESLIDALDAIDAPSDDLEPDEDLEDGDDAECETFPEWRPRALPRADGIKRR